MGRWLGLSLLGLLLAGCATVPRGMSEAGPNGTVIDGQHLSAEQTIIRLDNEGALDALDAYRQACLDAIQIRPPHPVLGAFLGGVGGLMGFVAGAGLVAALNEGSSGDNVSGDGDWAFGMAGLGWKLGQVVAGNGPVMDDEEQSRREFERVKRLYAKHRRLSGTAHALP